MKNLKNQKLEFLLSEEIRLLALVDKLAGFKCFMKGERARAIGTLRVVQSELNRR